MYQLDFTATAASHLRAYRKFEQQIILDATATQLPNQPLTETRNRKRLGENPLADWELRVDNYRVFYDVITEGDGGTVKIKAIGHKVHNKLYIGGKEFQL